MVRIRLNDRTFEYDVRALTKAFFKEDEMIVEDVDSLKNDIDTEKDDYAEGCVFIIDTSKDMIKLDISNKEKNIHEDLEETIPSYIKVIDNELDYKAKYKNFLKRLIYRLLSDVLDMKLPWGTLTGIRPSKIALEMLEQGREDD